MTKKVPFYGNTYDDTHCFQAALKMILGYYFPDEEYTWKELENISAKVEGLWTWPTAGLLYLQQKGLTIKIIEIFDSPRFVDEGEKYLLEFFGDDVGKEQIKYSDIPQERKLIKEALKLLDIEKRLPSVDDLIKLLNTGNILICNVNSKALNDQVGYVGHFVVLYDYQDGQFILHDPGLPPREARKVTADQFLKAWAYPDDNAKSVTAIKREQS